MRYILPILLVVSTLSAGQAARRPEPVPSAALQMFMQLETLDWILKAEALDYLSRYDVPNAEPAVRKILDDKHPNNRWLRGQAMIAMARIKPDNAAALAKAHVQDPHAEVRVAVVQVCADLPKAQATPILEKLLEVKTPSVQFAALAAYARHHGAQAWTRAEPLTANIPKGQIEPAARTLGWIGTEPALARLGQHIAKGKHSREILAGLKGVTNSALAPIYLDLIASSSDPALLAIAWAELKTFKRDAVVAACRMALASGDEKKVQAVARLVAGYLKEPALGKALQTVLAETKDRTTLLLGLSALSFVEADRFSAFFVTQLAHDDPQVRIAAVSCLAQCKKVNLYKTLEKTLTDKEARVRVAALRALRNAVKERVPQDSILKYFTPSLLASDKATRQAAIDTLVPFITRDNGEAAFGVMQKMQNKYGASGIKPLMQAVFRMVPEEKSAEILEARGYVTRWHVIGAFPSGFAAPGADVDGFKVAYPPEQEVDLTKRYKVKYNIKTDTRHAKKVNEIETGWVPATVGNADGVLFMTKAGRSQLLLPRTNGVCYAYTEISVPAKTDVRLSFLFNEKDGTRVWLNDKVLSLASKVDAKQVTPAKTAQVTLSAGKNRLLVKVVGRRGSGRHGRFLAKIPGSAFALSLADKDGKPVKWSYK